MPYVYTVGLLDGTDPNAWSALRASRNAVAQWQSLGYTGAVLDEVPGVNHYTYDFRGIVRDDLDALLERAATGEPTIDVSDSGSNTVTVSASGFVPGTSVHLTLTQGQKEYTFVADGPVAYDGTFSGLLEVDGLEPDSGASGKYDVTVTIDGVTSDRLRIVVVPEPHA